MPQSGCYAITSDGACISYFTTLGVNWRDARVECLLRGYDLTTITSSQEMFLLDTGGICWLGLNDIGSRLTFSWIDGSDATFRVWNTRSRPDSTENCVYLYGGYNYYFMYDNCADTHSCYYCGANSKYTCYIVCGLEVDFFFQLNIWSGRFQFLVIDIVFTFLILGKLS